MTWAQEQRQAFIRERIERHGFINRAHLMREFDICAPQASIDLRAFMRKHRKFMTYNPSEKRYESVNGVPRPTYGSSCDICTRTDPHEHKMAGRWIGVDFDGTLATDPPGRKDPYVLGRPIPAMVERVNRWIAAGYKVVIFTARCAEYSHTAGTKRDVGKMVELIRDWCAEHLGTRLCVTNVKDGAMEVLWDDRAVRVLRDTGAPAEHPSSASTNDCTHPHDRQMYKQYSSVETASAGITVADLFGGMNPFDWRIEYCGACRKVLRTYGQVPPGELPRGPASSE